MSALPTTRDSHRSDDTSAPTRRRPICRRGSPPSGAVLRTSRPGRIRGGLEPSLQAKSLIPNSDRSVAVSLMVPPLSFCRCDAIVSRARTAFSMMFSSPTWSPQDDHAGKLKNATAVLRAHASSPKQQPEELRDRHSNGEGDQAVSDPLLLARVVRDRPFSAPRPADAIAWARPFAFAAVDF